MEIGKSVFKSSFVQAMGQNEKNFIRDKSRRNFFNAAIEIPNIVTIRITQPLKIIISVTISIR